VVRTADDPPARWVTASDLAEYAFCPRAYWYTRHPPAEGPEPSNATARHLGERYHARTLATRYRRERWSTVWWLLVAAGVFLCLLALLQVGGI
jgi:CRISPR/Cas system-associated exonuclease Cas4 (RecB family)